MIHLLQHFIFQRERQTQRENTLELTEKLDSDWKEIQTFLAHRSSKTDTKNQVEEKPKVSWFVSGFPFVLGFLIVETQGRFFLLVC